MGALILLSLLGSTLSLYRITEVNRSLDAINRVSVPLGRLLVQMQTDSEVFRRELERRLGFSHWNDEHWRPRPMPRWIEDVIQGEIERVTQLISSDLPWATPEARNRWRLWAEQLGKGLQTVRESAANLHQALARKDDEAARKIYPEWTAHLDDWTRNLQWGVNEYERSLRQSFTRAEHTVAELRTGLEIILAVVVGLSLLLLWLGERALRPLAEIRSLAQEITRRGLRREDKAQLPSVPLSRNDEVSELAREFHRMATALLEREKIVEAQSRKLVQAENLASIGRLSAQVAHEVRNPLHSIGLEAELAFELASRSGDLHLRQSIQSILGSVERLEKITENYLKLSRLSAGRQQDFEISSALEAVLATYAPECESQGVRVDWKLESGIHLAVHGDRDLIEQVLGNLLRNSLQALAEARTANPEIRFWLGTLESGRVMVRIEDNGPGVPAAVRDKLFTPFVTSRAQGTGLGLPFVKKVIEEHGGAISYRENAEGGACFEIVLPPSGVDATWAAAELPTKAELKYVAEPEQGEANA